MALLSSNVVRTKNKMALLSSPVPRASCHSALRPSIMTVHYVRVAALNKVSVTSTSPAALPTNRTSLVIRAASLRTSHMSILSAKWDCSVGKTDKKPERMSLHSSCWHFTLQKRLKASQSCTLLTQSERPEKQSSAKLKSPTLKKIKEKEGRHKMQVDDS